jgi:acyl-CoA synthetase (AMP-forming)/AMP-acid ligase II
MNQGESEWVKWDDEKASKETVAARLFSSGTTGLPKAVEMTHYNFIAQHTMVLEWKPRDYDVSRQLLSSSYRQLLMHRRWYDYSAPRCFTSATSPAPIPALFAAA